MRKKGSFVNVVKVDVFRVFSTPPFYAACLLLFLVNMFSICNEAKPDEGCIVYYFTVFIFDGAFSVVIPFLGTLPFSNSFCVDWKNSYFKSLLIRCSINKYCWSKVVVTAFSAFLIVMMGNILSSLFLSIQWPLIGNEYYEFGYSIYDNNVIGQLIDFHPLLYLFARFSLQGVAAAFWAVFTLFISSFSTNLYVVYATPIIGYYVAIHFPLPYYLKLNVLTGGRTNLGSLALSVLFPVLFFVFQIIIFGCFFRIQIGRKLAHENS